MGVSLAKVIPILLSVLIMSACGGDTRAPSSPSSTPSAPPSATQSPSTAPTCPKPGQWCTLAPMPTPRTEVAVAVYDRPPVGATIFVIGGFEADGSPSTKVETYDTVSGAWTDGPSLPEPRHHAAAVFVDTDLFLIGGFETSFDDPQDTVFAYNVIEREWEDSTPLPAPRGGHGAAALDGKLYVVGGVGTGRENIADVVVYPLESVIVGDHAQIALDRQWTTVAPLPTPRDHLAVVALEFRVYAIGGRSGLDFGRNLSAAEAYEPKTNTWTKIPELPTARSGIAAAPLGHRLFAFGGEGPDGTFDANEAYVPARGAWQTLPPMPTARHGLGTAVVGDSIYVIAGGPTPGLSVTGVTEAFTP